MLNRLCTLHLLIAQLGLCALLLTATPAAAAAASFDGSWSVRIVTQHGTCDSGATVPDSVVTAPDSGGATASPAIRLRVSLASTIAMTPSRTPMAIDAAPSAAAT